MSDQVPLIPPPPSPRRSMPRGAIIGLIAGGVALVVLIGAAVWGAVSIVQAVSHRPASAGSSSGSHNLGGITPLSGAPGSPTALEPVECAQSCYAEFPTPASEVIPPPSAAETLGLTVTNETWGDYADSVPSDEITRTAKHWRSDKGTPDTCFPLFFDSPIVAAFGTTPADDGSAISFTGGYTNDAKSAQLSQTGRLFPDSASAVAYMKQLSAVTAACQQYDYTIDGAVVRSTVTQAAALDGLPTSEAAVGWVEDSDNYRFYTFDLQRGNLVVRTTMSVNSNAVTEKAFRSFVVQDAQQMAQLKTPGATPQP